MEDEELLFLLNQAQEINLQLNITGMLLYKGGNFMQLIEGNQQVVEQLYEKIRCDSRHKDVIQLITSTTENRSFQDWSMGFCNMDNIKSLPNFNEYIDKTLTLESFEINSPEAYKFMVGFNARNN